MVLPTERRQPLTLNCTRQTNITGNRSCYAVVCVWIYLVIKYWCCTIVVLYVTGLFHIEWILIPFYLKCYIPSIICAIKRQIHLCINMKKKKRSRCRVRPFLFNLWAPLMPLPFFLDTFTWKNSCSVS